LEGLTTRTTALEGRASSTDTKVGALEKQITAPDPTFAITAAAALNGAIAPIGTTEAVAGSSRTFTIVPAPGFHVQDVLVDGISQGPVTTYTLAGIAANHTIQASFARDSDPCQDCLSRLNSATSAQFDAVDGIGEVKAQALVDGQPYVVPMCSLADIKAVLDSVEGIGDVLRESVVRHFCPDFYRE
jgi:hypothetical protein